MKVLRDLLSPGVLRVGKTANSLGSSAGIARKLADEEGDWPTPRVAPKIGLSVVKEVTDVKKIWWGLAGQRVNESQNEDGGSRLRFLRIGCFA